MDNCHTVPGLPLEDQQIIQQRLNVVQKYLLRWLPGDHPYRGTVENGQVPVELPGWFSHFERTITCYEALQRDPPDTANYRAGVQDWQTNYLYPLVQELHVIPQVEATICRTCRRRGFFDMPDPTTGNLARPDFAPLLSRVRTLMHEVRFKTNKHPEASRVTQLQQRGLCRDQACAEQVAEAFDQAAIVQHAAGLARGMLLSYFQHGAIGLLSSADCPYLNALLLLEHQKQLIAPDEQPPAHMWTGVRADLIAFYQAAHSVHPKLWNERLLHEPANSPTRQNYQNKHLWPRQRERFVAAIQQQRGCSADEACALLDILVQAGLPRLIDWRCGFGAGQTRHTMEQRRIQRDLDHHLSVLDPDDRHTIEVLVYHLVAAMNEAQVALPLAMLLNEYPSSYRRRRLGRRFWFGLAAILHRRESRRQRRQQYRSRFLRRKQSKTSNQKPHDTSADRLVAAFARHAGLDVADARTLLRDFITYGVLGLLPRAARVSAVYQPLVSWLALIKWGRLPGRVPWLEVVRQVNRYGEHLGLAGSFSPQLTRGVFNGIAKPAYWHGGQGKAVEQVRQRATVNIDRIPRLHATWVLAPVQMPLLSRDDNVQIWHGMLVFDRESQLPMGVCFSKHQPGMREVRLAVYDAIWHPADPDWYLHGIPETIQVPQEFAAEGMHDLEQAAAFLLMEIDTQRKKPWLGLKAVNKVLDDVRKRGGEQIKRVLSECDDLPASQITRTLLYWLKETCFPGHNPARAPQSIREHGVAMPGFETPGAGWLLPITGYVETVTDGVWYQGARYTSHWFHSEPEQKLPYRAFPFFFPSLDTDGAEATQDALFVEGCRGTETILYHLTRQG